MGPQVNNILVLVKPLSEPMMTQFNDAYNASLGLNEFMTC